MSASIPQSETQFSGFSSEYADVRTRELEGTYPNDPHLGVWAINSWRVAMGWGCVPKDVYPVKGSWPYSPASDFDQQAKEHRIAAFFRVYDADDSIQFAESRLPVNSCFYVTDKWACQDEGVLNFPQSREDIVGGHSLSLEIPHAFSPIPTDWKGDDFFVFKNTWGREWGNRGWGAMTKQFFNENMYESWCPFPETYKSPDGNGIELHSPQIGITRDRHLFLQEVIDHEVDDRLAWMIAVMRHGVLHVEDLYVKPDQRGKGHASSLMENLRELVSRIGCDVKFWVPFADIDCEEKIEQVVKLFKKFELKLEVSPHQWAAYVASPGTPVNNLPEIWIPPKPAYCISQPKKESIHWKSLQEHFDVSDQTLDATKEVFGKFSGVFKRLS